MRKGETSVKLSDKIYCKISFEWIEGKSINPHPFQLDEGEIPVFGVVKVRCK